MKRALVMVAVLGWALQAQGYPFNAKTATLEETCVVLNTEPYAKDIDPVKVKRFKYLLDSLQARHPETRKQLGDLTSRAQGALKDRGIRESLLEIMESLNQVRLAKSLGKVSYKDLVTAYVTVRADGMSRTDAAAGIQEYYQGVARTKR